MPGIGFASGKPYAINGPNGAFITDQYIRAAHGKATKEFPFIATSSGKFTDVSYTKTPFLFLDLRILTEVTSPK